MQFAVLGPQKHKEKKKERCGQTIPHARSVSMADELGRESTGRCTCCLSLVGLGRATSLPMGVIVGPPILSRIQAHQPSLAAHAAGKR